MTKSDLVSATLFEHEDGRRTIWPGTESPPWTCGDPKWHRVGPVDASSIAASAAAAGPTHAQIQWDTLHENAGERAMFDSNLDLLYCGDPRVAIATSLRIWAHTPGNGSFGDQCAVYANEVAKMLIAGPSQEAPTAPAERWCPDVCPITGLPFFMWIEHHATGEAVPTYGGPHDSYTIPVMVADGSFERECYDHDEGYWRAERDCLGVKLVDDPCDDIADALHRVRELRAEVYRLTRAENARAGKAASAAPVVWRMREEFVAWAEVAYRHEQDFSKRDFDICLKAWQFGGASALLAAQATPAAPSVDAFTHAELLEVQRAVEEFKEVNETDVNYGLLMRAAQAGYLECSQFHVLNQSALDSDTAAAQTKEGSAA